MELTIKGDKETLENLASLITKEKNIEISYEEEVKRDWESIRNEILNPFYKDNKINHYRIKSCISSLVTGVVKEVIGIERISRLNADTYAEAREATKIVVDALYKLNWESNPNRVFRSDCYIPR